MPRTLRAPLLSHQVVLRQALGLCSNRGNLTRHYNKVTFPVVLALVAMVVAAAPATVEGHREANLQIRCIIIKAKALEVWPRVNNQY